MAAYLIDGMILAIPSRLPAYVIGNLVLSLIIPFLAVGAYFVICWVRMRATFGYQGMGLRLVRTDEHPLDWGTAIVRYVALMFFQYLPILGLGVAAGGAVAGSPALAAAALAICLLFCVLGALNFL